MGGEYLTRDARDGGNYGGGVGALTPRTEQSVVRGGRDAETPVSQLSGLGSVLTGPGDESRAATKHELDRLRTTV